MVVDMRPVRMSADHKCEIAFRQPFRKLVPYPVGVFRRYLSRFERLYEQICDHIAFLLFARDSGVFMLGQGELRYREIGITLIV